MIVNFFLQMFVEQKKLKRQSQILIQNSGPDQPLIQALEQVQSLTGDLERERLQHQEQVIQHINLTQSGARFNLCLALGKSCKYLGPT